MTAGVGSGALTWGIAATPRIDLRRAKVMNTALDMSRDGRYVAAGGTDAKAGLWDAITGRFVGEPRRLGGGACAVAFSPDGQAVAVGDDGKSVRLFSVPDLRPTGVVINTGSATAMAFSPDGKALLTCEMTDNEARLWDPSTGQKLGKSLCHQGAVRAAAFAPDGSKVATAGDDRTARLWDVRTGDPIGGPLQHRGPVRSLAFSPDGTRLLVGEAVWGSTTRPSARLWNVTTGQPIGPPLAHPSSVTEMSFHPDGLRVLTGCEDGAGRLWDVATGQTIGPPLQHSAPVSAVRFSPDGRVAATGGLDNTVRLWDSHTGRPIGPALDYIAAVNWLRFDPNGRRLLRRQRDVVGRDRLAPAGPAAAPTRRRGHRPRPSPDRVRDGRARHLPRTRCRRLEETPGPSSHADA